MEKKKYNVSLSKTARKFLDKLPEKLRNDILEDIYKLPWEGNITTIKGVQGKILRLRTHGVRVFYTVEHDRLLVLVLDIDNRGDAYK